ncbi:monovalent cation:proton antiporter-2 (CPA2) family protein [Corallococcus llansteffanensis]|uniref:Glutathione-regulated potassium-efflux system protein KefB n=1 Tax=Corallococcus llansteffanensis TaxID=2316731 RepID=A0A3A8QIF0_9BACT|nr:monovalent cation:proton antiporter-2 (CPA2) family protein [Corallococcus llansteffanensis]RKH68519.1 glutathione-regulated potassium-efflux system protein KefB [Corallococcus llansteffanensis]
MSFMHQALVFLAATVVAVPLFKKLGLGSVLGYLAAGAAIGPYGAGLISDVENILHIAELGVVLLLFVIGLELQPSRLWSLRRSVFGMGGAQVVLTGVLLAGVGRVLGLSTSASIIAGFGLSLSSTAFALQLLAEKNQLTAEHGQLAFGILLFQDLAVIPLLAALPLLGVSDTPSTEPGWLMAVKAAGVVILVVLAGRYLLRPVFRAVASVHSQELFTATALLVVVGTASLVSAVGLSMALGAFLAGVLLSESEYRHELEADIEPFKGLLLGLFFIAVGMSVNLALLAREPLRVLALVLGLTFLKGLVLYGLGRVGLKKPGSALSLAVVISQGGEFAFVLFSLAVSFHVMDRPQADLLVLVVGLSMAVTPFLSAVHERWVAPRFKPKGPQREYDVSPDQDHPVIIAGMGRVGQVVARLLRARRIGFTAIDASAEHIDFIRRFGNQVFYGDASRLDLLRAARSDKARVFVLAIDDMAASLRTAQMVKEHFPHLKVFARARNREHAYKLMELGITNLVRETFDASLVMSNDVLQAMGLSFTEARRTVERFREHDESLMVETSKVFKDEKKMMEVIARGRRELELLFEKDEAEQKSA